ncbi:glycosyltransferase family 4 protein [Methylobacterium brachythecii]|uniref:Glycosyltransferase involved in cell wall biosynthesis n=1 Tax=Methylobacterium brachythecii TaxID=1176177 RepID=A0A7W6AGA5_9HYPH|nr:glycosyltransferase [Methylobacterium brachythecii]MBB3902128.1 glycosyltransferase involved in cell wall biosynthesis [Methylobacterium brachythecii]GLS44525.1 hypothetical protein GCM10007884_25130 [Methylobacterium brachythecii]
MSGVPAQIRVLCVTPSGLGGRGGIDRLYYYLRNSSVAMPGIELRFGAARGEAGSTWPLAFPGRLAALWHMMRDFRPHVVHVNFAMRGSAVRKLAVVRLARAFDARVVVHLHDSLPIASLARGGVQGWLFLAICRSADAVLALGCPAAAQMAAAGVDPARIRVVVNGIPDFASDIVLPKPRRADVSILLAGRIGVHKGADILLDALALLRARGIGSWRCTMAGDGEVAAYTTRATELGLADAVHFTGWIDADEVHALMRESDIVVLPSIAEALPLSLAEGACAGAALVATRVGNVEEIVHDGENGRLVARDPGSLADALAGLLADRETLDRMQCAARRRYQDGLTIETFAAALGAIYADTAGTDFAGRTSAPARAPGMITDGT